MSAVVTFRSAVEPPSAALFSGMAASGLLQAVYGIRVARVRSEVSARTAESRKTGPITAIPEGSFRDSQRSFNRSVHTTNEWSMFNGV